MLKIEEKPIDSEEKRAWGALWFFSIEREEKKVWRRSNGEMSSTWKINESVGWDTDKDSRH